MSLLDTIDGSFMNFAYGWAFSQPVRKVFYNLTVTGLSVAVALVIGTIELLSIAVERLDLSGGFWGWVAGIDLNALGYVVFGLFVATWALALAVWRFGRIEERWGALARARLARGARPRPAAPGAGIQTASSRGRSGRRSGRGWLPRRSGRASGHRGGRTSVLPRPERVRPTFDARRGALAAPRSAIPSRHARGHPPLGAQLAAQHRPRPRTPTRTRGHRKVM